MNRTTTVNNMSRARTLPRRDPVNAEMGKKGSGAYPLACSVSRVKGDPKGFGSVTRIVMRSDGVLMLMIEEG